METKIVPVDAAVAACEVMKKRVELRALEADAFVERHASGTLRKNKRLGMAWRDQYLVERTAWEFGWVFECLPRSRVTFGDAFTEGDNKALTEAGWHIERYIELSAFPEDRFETKYITVEYKDDAKKEGVGIIVRQTSAAFVPSGHVLFAIVSEFDPKTQRWHEAQNPR
ncbi:MAG: hypothetical protein IT381_07915 [Deltaproteobacteria bacterium]|nr:hypothetical protein [Deltaproteobacteria bacterium]